MPLISISVLHRFVLVMAPSYPAYANREGRTIALAKLQELNINLTCTLFRNKSKKNSIKKVVNSHFLLCHLVLSGRFAHKIYLQISTIRVS